MKMTVYKKIYYKIFTILFIILFLISAQTDGKKTTSKKRELKRTASECMSDVPAMSKKHKQNSEISSQIAQKAAQEAVEATDSQESKGLEASIKVKTQLAEKAEGAARAAQVALAGKEAMVDKIEQQIAMVQGEDRRMTDVLGRTSTSVNIAQREAAQTENLLKTLNGAMQLAQELSQGAISELDALKKEYNVILEAIEESKKKLVKLKEELRVAQEDMDCTMDAEKKAVSSAKTAQNNASQNTQRAAGSMDMQKPDTNPRKEKSASKRHGKTNHH